MIPSGQDNERGLTGLEISRRFFDEWGLPWLQQEWPDLANRVAAGRVGGSDIIGADDEWSRDHDWGPRFDLWLTREDQARFGRRLRQEINAAAPREFMGARHHFFGERKENVGVESIDSCIAFHAGVPRPPERARDWFRPHGGQSIVERESWLYFLRHGPIFYDPSGEFTCRRDAFAHYPRDVRLKVMHAQCITLWYVGHYKFRWRLIYRHDPYPFHSAVNQTVEAAMRLSFYLNDDFAPHWQWLHHEFGKLPEAKDLGPVLDRFLAGNDAMECSAVVTDITNILTARLAEGGWIESGHHDMQRAADELQGRISDRVIRGMY
jgi:hypothetical protein